MYNNLIFNKKKKNKDKVTDKKIKTYNVKIKI